MLLSPLALAFGLVNRPPVVELFKPGPVDTVLACPTTKSPLMPEKTVLAGVLREVNVAAEGGTRYPVVRLRDGSTYADLHATAGRTAEGREGVLSWDELTDELRAAWNTRTQVGTFRSPFTAFLYERGWRQNFRNAGFPGVDKEYREAAAFFCERGVVVDLSCGTGLMTRRLVRSARFDRVLALDYSEAMLTETARRFRAERIDTSSLTLARADVAQLPLRPSSVDAVHAGAALHCWPEVEAGLREIHAALKPGGKLFATTFLTQAAPFVGATGEGGGSFRFFRLTELQGLLRDAGFKSVEVRQEGLACAVVRAEKLAEK
jgi:SAM-dependent methyltransferase